jgi:uncharacterized protein
MTFRSAIYSGLVIHERIRPKWHRLRYRVFSVLFDLDELPALDAHLWLFSYNRRGPVSFHDRDHGPTTGAPLRPWVEARMRAAGVEPDGGPIRLMCYPRIFGYVFNPISIYFCYRRAGELTAILYEVCNTYGERHTYGFPVSKHGQSVIPHGCDKSLYVSPFIAMAANYRFRVVPPGDDVAVVVRLVDLDGPMLTASFTGKRQALTGATLALALTKFPFLTLKVIGAIHWEALKMWIRGFPVFHHTPPRAPGHTSGEHTETKNI